MNWIAFLSIVIVFELVADVFSKEWSLHSSPLYWIAATGAYLIANIFWLFALKNGVGLGRGVVIFAVVTAVVASIIGIVFYKEQLEKIQLVGVGIGIFSLVLIFWNK
jgi:multidrug transporter EmrE-like cation transporter